MPRSATTGVYARVSNSFSSPVFGTLIDPTDAEAYFDDLDVGLNPPELDGPVRFINSLQVGTTGSAAGTVDFLNATSGTISLSPPTGALGTRVLTLPIATDTLIGKATTDTLTNKTYDTAGAGNSFSINGLAVGANTGTGLIVRDTSPTLVTPNLGTPSAATLTSATGLPVSTGISGLGTGVATFLATPSSANLASALTDETGTGANVFATSPTITTPNIVGTSTNNNASAGSVGEYQETVITSGSAVSRTSGVTADLMTLSLTAGDWDVWANVVFLPAAGTTTTEYHICVSTVTNTLQFNPSAHALHVSVPASQAGIIPSGTLRVSLSGTSTMFLVTTQTFAVSTMTAYGFLCARRRR